MTRQADIVTLHAPAKPDTHHMINAAGLALMKDDALLINTARGTLIDESALYDALQSRHLQGAALDVFQREPYSPCSPEKDLRILPNVLMTPHIGSNTTEANNAMARSVLKNINAFLNTQFHQLDRVD